MRVGVAEDVGVGAGVLVFVGIGVEVEVGVSVIVGNGVGVDIRVIVRVGNGVNVLVIDTVGVEGNSGLITHALTKHPILIKIQPTFFTNRIFFLHNTC